MFWGHYMLAQWWEDGGDCCVMRTTVVCGKVNTRKKVTLVYNPTAKSLNPSLRTCLIPLTCQTLMLTPLQPRWQYLLDDETLPTEVEASVKRLKIDKTSEPEGLCSGIVFFYSRSVVTIHHNPVQCNIRNEILPFFVSNGKTIYYFQDKWQIISYQLMWY